VLCFYLFIYSLMALCSKGRCIVRTVNNSLVVIGLVYKAYPDGCRHKYTFLPKPRPYPVRGHWLL